MKVTTRLLTASLRLSSVATLGVSQAPNAERAARETHTAAAPQRREKRIERIVRKEFHNRPRMWLAEIKLTGEQHRQIERIEQKTLEDLRAIGRDVDAREENG